MPFFTTQGITPLPPSSVGGFNDGSANAPVGGNFQLSAATWWTSYAPQSGQSYGGRRPPWLVAGIDYAIGYASAATPLKTPSAINMPSGATFAGATITINDANITFDGYDFSSPSSVAFNNPINPSGPGFILFQNCKFVVNRAGMDPWWLWTLAAGIEFQFINCYIDFAAPSSFGDPTNGIIGQLGTNGSSPGGKSTFRYCAILNTIGHAITHQELTMEYCYVEGLNFDSGAHGEWTIISNTDATARTIPRLNWTGCTFLQPSTYGTVDGIHGGATTGLYLDSGTPNAWTVTNINIDHCQFISNLYVPGGIGSSITYTAFATSGDPRVVYTNGPTYSYNYIDGTGAAARDHNYTDVITQPAATWTGNLDLTTGIAITDYDP